MKITKKQLKRLIKEETRKILKESIEDEVAEAIAWYTSGDPQAKISWRMAVSDFMDMAAGDTIPGVSDKYYVGWLPQHFEQVIQAVEG